MHFLLALITAILMTGCATNPATGKKQISLMSESREVELGRELDAQVRREMRMYDDDDLQRYVQDLGMRLALKSERPNLPWSFTVVDSPAVNAFALPGGYIYITRGIFPYLDNEAQLVGVLGHEIGHVTARHAAQQYTRSLGATIGLVAASILVPEVRPLIDVASTGADVLFLKFGRDAELQADALGAQYTADGGWDPDEVPVFLTTLARIADVTDRSGVPNWLSTHPPPANRAAKVGQSVQKVRATTTPPAGTTWTTNRDDYLTRIDGMIFGDSPEDGIVRGNVFLHPKLRFALEFPTGWEITNSEDQVVAQEPGNKVFMVFRMLEPTAPRTLRREALEHMKSSGYKMTDQKHTTIDGLEAVIGTYEGNAKGVGKVMARGAHFRSGRNTYFIGGIAAPDMYPRVSASFDKAIQSYQQLSRDEADAIQPNRIDFYTTRTGDTWQSIAQGVGQGLVSAATLAIMNNHAVDVMPAPGTQLKIVVMGAGAIPAAGTRARASRP